MLLFRSIPVPLTVTFLSGCQLNMRSSVDDLTSNNKLKEWKGKFCKKTSFFS